MLNGITMKFFLKLSLLSLALFFIISVATVFACKYHYSTLLTQKINFLNKQLPMAISQVDSNDEAAMALIKSEFQLETLQIETTGSRHSIQLTFTTEPQNLAQFLLSKNIQEQQLQTKNGLIRYKVEASKLYQQMNEYLLRAFIFIILIFIVFQLIQFRVMKKLQQKLIDEIDIEGESADGFDLVSKHLTNRKNDLFVQINQQQLQIRGLLKEMELDQLTGLHNRKSFRKSIVQLLEQPDESQAALIIIRSTALDEINQYNGHQFGDQYLQEVTSAIQHSVKSFTGLKLHRISGGDFAILAADTNANIAQELVIEIHNHFDSYQELHEIDCVGYIGFTIFHGGEMPEQVIARADLALAKAQTKGANGWAEQINDACSTQGEQHWKVIIQQIIESKQVELYEQTINAVSAGMISYRELFSHFYNEDGSKLPSDAVFNMAQRLDRSTELEKMVIQSIFEQLPPSDTKRYNWGINISSTSVQSSVFTRWLEKLLRNNPEIASTLVFEIDEAVLDKNLIASKRLFAMFKNLHCRTCIKKFGRGIASFKLFKSVKPDMVKIDGAIISNIQNDSANQQFVRMLIDVAHRMDCMVIAESVEEYEQKQVLETMNLDALQGYFFAKPHPIFEKDKD